ncbi:hypothetical protein DZF91_24670 [Actinomadura logoneensis]|uniref:Uncharacterized protein n=1 Tax=Actinomadura logoneensis TaxID=2293572 RepID=A0A372JGB5_9ACTN|nr:hypothetical protein DZF91_24670 [Actinomadura logoneensis]
MGRPDQPGGPDQGRTLWCAVGEGALGGLLAALLALSVWYLLPVPAPTAIERWLTVLTTTTAGGFGSAVQCLRRRPRSPDATPENE